MKESSSACLILLLGEADLLREVDLLRETDLRREVVLLREADLRREADLLGEPALWVAFATPNSKHKFKHWPIHQCNQRIQLGQHRHTIGK